MQDSVVLKEIHLTNYSFDLLYSDKNIIIAYKHIYNPYWKNKDDNEMIIINMYFRYDWKRDTRKEVSRWA